MKNKSINMSKEIADAKELLEMLKKLTPSQKEIVLAFCKGATTIAELKGEAV
jgi:hypothetical protein